MSQWFKRWSKPEVVVDDQGSYWFLTAGDLYRNIDQEDLLEADELEELHGPCAPMMYEHEDTGIKVSAYAIARGLDDEIRALSDSAADAQNDKTREFLLAKALAATKTLRRVRKLGNEIFELRGV